MALLGTRGTHQVLEAGAVISHHNLEVIDTCCIPSCCGQLGAMSSVPDPGAHRKPPDRMRCLFRHYQKSNHEALRQDVQVLDLASPALTHLQRLRKTDILETHALRQTFNDFLQTHSGDVVLENQDQDSSSSSVYEVNDIPGLFVIPSLLPHTVQIELLNRLLHRDLSNPKHKTNLHLHYNVPYEETARDGKEGALASPFASFFSLPPSTLLTAKDPSVHKPLSMRSVLTKKLRWITLGGQYDWTEKKYPPGPTPPFPLDIELLVHQLFPAIKAEAAIVNLYCPGDTLSVHRDVSEECDRGLVSFSIGCDAIFVVGNDDGSVPVVMRLRSGDVVCMTGASRYAWHAVPKVLSDTCPSWLKDWPATTTDAMSPVCESWRGWMANKRINLNIRQLVDDA